MNMPNRITIARICLIPIFITFCYLKESWAPYVAAGVFLIASVTDTLDGMLARKTQQVTTLGKLLDPIADKLLVSSALIILVERGLVPGIITIIIISREFIISAFRMIAIGEGLDISAQYLGKLKTVMQIIAVMAYLTEPLWMPVIGFNIANILMIIAVVITIWSIIDYIVRNKSVLNIIRGKNNDK